MSGDQWTITTTSKYTWFRFISRQYFSSRLWYGFGIWMGESEYSFSIHSKQIDLNFFVRFICWWKWFFLGNNSKRSKYLLSKTNSKSNISSNHRNTRIIDFCLQYSFEHWSKSTDEYLIGIYVSRNNINWITVK